MHVPEGCHAWKRMMEAGQREKRVLANVEADPCLDDEIEATFFERLAARSDPTSSNEAWGSAIAVVKSAPDRFVCQGREVPPNLFVRLFRLQDVSSLGYVLPESVRDAAGFRDKEFAADSLDEGLVSFIDEYDGPVNLGNLLQLVWATDFAATEDLLDKDLSQLADRLGLGLVADRVLVCVYNREDTGRMLHVPRALDAVNQPAFRVVQDCSADHGWTLPLTPSGGGGLPEAVHRSCSVVPRRWQVAELK